MTASQHHFDPNIYHYTASVTCMVHGQLFSHGRHRSSFRSQIWHQQSSSLDNRLIHPSYSKYYVPILTASPTRMSSVHKQKEPSLNELSHLNSNALILSLQEHRCKVCECRLEKPLPWVYNEFFVARAQPLPCRISHRASCTSLKRSLVESD